MIRNKQCEKTSGCSSCTIRSISAIPLFHELHTVCIGILFCRKSFKYLIIMQNSVIWRLCKFTGIDIFFFVEKYLMNWIAMLLCFCRRRMQTVTLAYNGLACDLSIGFKKRLKLANTIHKKLTHLYTIACNALTLRPRCSNCALWWLTRTEWHSINHRQTYHCNAASLSYSRSCCKTIQLQSVRTTTIWCHINRVKDPAAATLKI